MAEAPTGDDTLQPDDAVIILEELLEAQNESRTFGLKLNLPVHEVEAVFTKYSDPRDRLLQIIIAFLRRAEPRPTWRVIVDALRSDAVGLTALARRVEAAHFPDLAATRDVVPKTTVTAPAANLYDDGDEVKSKPSNPSDQLRIAQIEDDIKQFEKRFRQLKKMCRENLQKRNVPVSEVVDALTDLPADDVDEHKMFLEEKLSNLYKAPDHADLIGQLSFNMNYLSYHLLDYLANEFDLGDVKPEMELYKSDLKQFRLKTPLKLFCKTQKRRFVESPQDFQKIIAKFPKQSDVDVTLEDVELYRERYACHYNLRSFAIMVSEVRPGSFIITWLVPKSLIRKLKENIPRHLFIHYCVTKLEIEGSCVYDDGIVRIKSLQDLPKDIYERLISSRNFNVLVTGCYGVRKSTLINSLLSEEPVKYVLQVKEDELGVCNKVQRYILRKDGTIMNVYDSLSLQEDLSHLHMVCPQIDLLTYCSNMNETIEPAEITALGNITSIFGTIIWKNASIALANFDNLPNPERLKESKWTHLQEAFMGIGITSQVLANLKGRTYVTGSAGMGNDWSNQFWRDFTETHHQETRPRENRRQENPQGLPPRWSLATAFIAGTVVGVMKGFGFRAVVTAAVVTAAVATAAVVTAVYLHRTRAEPRKPELRELMKELESLSWDEVKRLSIELGLSHEDLRGIERYNDDENERFMNAMNLWLERDPEASWTAVVKALRAIHRDDLAIKTAETFEISPF